MKTMFNDENRFHLGDSFELLPWFTNNSIDMILTDPPYNFDHEQKQIIHKELLRICKGSVIVFSPPENQWILPADQYLFWTKPISTKNTSKRYSRFVEMIFVYGQGAWNTDRHWSQYTNIFHDLVDTVKFHSFRKPPSLIERLILNHSNEGDKVLDPFAGSGVVAEACKKLNRNFICIEKDENLYQALIENQS
jgi:DNA modification methylase